MKTYTSLIFLIALPGLLAFVAAANEGEVAKDTDLGVVDFKCPNGTYVVAHETRCELYYICGQDSPTHMYKCRDDLLFSHKFNGCDFKEMVDCGTRLPPFTCPSTNGDYPIKTGACDSRYFTCTNGTSVLKTCPSGGIFNASSGTCAAPGAITCPTTTTPRLPTSPGPYQCPSNYEGNIRSPYTCTQYYTCTNGQTHLFECPSNLYYNEKEDKCDYKQNVPECTKF